MKRIMEKHRNSIKHFLTAMLTAVVIIGSFSLIPASVVHANDADLQKITALKEKIDSEKPTFRPHYGTNTNINDMVLAELKKYDGLSTDGVTVEVATSDEAGWISAEAGANNGKISYGTSESLNQYGMNYKNVICTFNIKAGDETVTTEQRTVTVGWDVSYVNGKISADKESNAVIWDTIKGENTSKDAVTSNLSLPQICSNSARTSWSLISWTSSNEEIISIDEEPYTGVTTPKIGTVNRPKNEDVEVTLTATFRVNDNIINSNVEKVSDFKTYTKTFEVTVEGQHIQPPTPAELNELIHTYYLTDNNTATNKHGKTPYQNLTVSSGANSGNVIDINNVAYDIQLPIPSRIKKLDENGAEVKEDGKTVLVFPDNKEIKLSVVDAEGNPDNESLIKVNGYRISVDRGATEKKNCYLKITFTRDNVTTSEVVKLTVVPFTDEEINAAKAQMDFAIAHYWDAINDDTYDKNNVTGNLHAFYEINKDNSGNPVVCYSQPAAPGTGIQVQGYFDNAHSVEMEGAGYNAFKSSKPRVIQHENLVYTGKPEYDTSVTVSSILCHAAFKETALKHPENTKLSQLINREATTTFTVPGTKGKDPNASADGVHKDINVSLTVTIKGSVAKAKDGSLMAQKKLTVKDADKNGEITFHEVLTQAHAKFNSLSGYEGGDTGYVTKLWGTSTGGDCGFLSGNKYTDAVNQALVEDGDNLVAFASKASYYDGNFDKFSYFTENTKSVKANEEFTLNLKGEAAVWGNPAINYQGITVKDEAGNVLGKTNSNGMVTIKIANGGTHTIIAEGTVTLGGKRYTIVPATFIVTVTGNQTPAPVVSIKKLTLDKTATVSKGKKITLVPTVTPANASVSGLKWSSSNTKVATVTQKGVVTGVNTGTANITVKTADGKIKATCKVTVKKANEKIAVTKVTLNKKTASLEEGKKLTLKATVSPSNASNKKVTWSSNKTGVATVKNGVVTAKKAGKAVITVKTADKGKTAKCTITVTKKKAVLKSIALSKKTLSLSLKNKKTYTLKVTPNPKSYVLKNLKWSSNKTSVVTVKDGKLTAKKTGTATITVKTSDGKFKKTCKVTVKK